MKLLAHVASGLVLVTSLAAQAADTPQATATAQAEGGGGSFPAGAIAGAALIVLAAGALYFGLRARRR